MYTTDEGTVNFTAQSVNVTGNVTYTWNFGDGSAPYETGTATASHTYTAAGLYAVSVTLTDDLGSASYTMKNGIAVIDSTVDELYAATSGSDDNDGTSAYPFRTIAHAVAVAGELLARSVASVTVRVADGDYQEKQLTLNGAITVTGNAAGRTAVRIGFASETSGRVFTLSAAGATLANLTVRNGKNALGSSINMIAGTMVTNCIVTGGQSVVTGTQDYGSNIYMTGGTVSCCEVKNRSCSAMNNNSVGLGIYATGGLIENCYIHGNYGGTNGSRTGGVDLRRAAYLVNCTVADIYNSKDKTEGKIFQVRVASGNARVVNCVLFKAVDRTGGIYCGDNGGCYYGCAASTAITGGKNCIVIDSLAFAGAEAGDYRPVATSPLLDSGDANESVKYSTYAHSTVDMLGNARVSPSAGTIDIGCYEFEQSAPTAGGVPDRYSAVTGTESVRFTASAIGTGSSAVKFKWNFDDGPDSEVITAQEFCDYSFDNTGLHNVSVSVSVDDGAHWSEPSYVAEQVVTHPAVMFVDPEKNSTPTFPYATKQTAAWTVIDALNCLTNNFSANSQVSTVVAEIRLLDGDIAETNIRLNAAVTVTSDSQNAARVSIAGSSSARVFYLNHAAAKVTHLTVKDGTCTSNGYVGNNIYVNRGIVEDCIVKDGGGATANGRGGNIYLFNGRVSRCVLSGGKCTYSGSGTGSNIVVDGAGTVENCLIIGGKGASSNYKAQAYLGHASARMINCTIIKGTCSNESGLLGVYVNDASARVVNCVIYGNGDTATKEWGNANASCFINCATSVGAAFTGGTANVSTVTDACFKDYANGDYMLASMVDGDDNPLRNAGCTWSQYENYGAISTRDLVGENRLRGRFLDIGCYEGGSMALTIMVK